MEKDQQIQTQKQERESIELEHRQSINKFNEDWKRRILEDQREYDLEI